MALPDFVSRGDYARLFPVISDTRKEQRVTSIFLAVLSAVPQFARAVLSPLGQKIGKSSLINTYIETEFGSGPTASIPRPDGLIEIKGWKNSWYALVEAKIGNAPLDSHQVETYLQIARDNSIDALLTISNQFSTRPNHHPLNLSSAATKRVDLYHLSWKSILTEAVILHENAAISDPEQAILLRELIHFLSHESVGVSGYVSMPGEWRDIIALIQAGAALNPRDPKLEAIVAGWHQELRDLTLMMGRQLGEAVELRMTKQESGSVDMRIKNDIAALCGENVLTAKIGVKNAASDIVVKADLRARNIRVGMKLNAPKDRKSTLARVNWLLRQIKEVPPELVTIHLDWPARAEDTVYTLQQLLDDAAIVKNAGPKTLPKSFEIVMSSDSGRRFSGRQTVIEDIERLVPEFYAKIGQRLRQWQPAPPKPKQVSEKQTTAAASDVNRPSVPVGNDFARVSYLPEFWRRIPSIASVSKSLD